MIKFNNDADDDVIDDDVDDNNDDNYYLQLENSKNWA